MVAQKQISFQYLADKSQKHTAFGGLPLYFELSTVSGVLAALERHLRLKQAGREDVEIVLTIVLLNLVGGERAEDVNLLERDQGLRRIMHQAKLGRLKRKEKRLLIRAWDKAEKHGTNLRVFPSPDTLLEYLRRFHDDATEQKRREAEARGTKAFIPDETAALRALWLVIEEQLAFLFRHHQHVTEATLDMDATLVETYKSSAKRCYKGFKAFQPLNVYWYELDAIVYSEFRDGNVPASYKLLDVFKRALDTLPEGVERVCLRSDTAGYDWKLLNYCARGMHERFGRIDFAVGADVTDALKKEVAKLSDSDWKRLYKTTKDGTFTTSYEYAEVCFVPNGASMSKAGPTYRYIVTRKPLQQRLLLGDVDNEIKRQQSLPFPTMDIADDSGKTSPYKLYAIVTTITDEEKKPDEIIWWYRERCGKSEEAHSVMKKDLAGGILPSETFGANAAWWTIMLLAFNLSTTMKRLVLGKEHARRRMKSIRLLLINIAGRVVSHARRLALKVAQPAFELLEKTRETIWSLVIPEPRAFG